MLTAMGKMCRIARSGKRAHRTSDHLLDPDVDHALDSGEAGMGCQEDLKQLCESIRVRSHRADHEAVGGESGS